MKRPLGLYAALATLALGAGTLAACGHSDKAGAGNTAENVEGPAEEALSSVPASGTPMADPNATATDGAAAEAAATQAATTPSDLAKAAAQAAASASGQAASTPAQ